MSQLPRSVVCIGPLAVECRHRRSLTEGVVGIVKPAVDVYSSGCVVDEMQNVAVRIVNVSRVRPVGVVLPEQSSCCVVSVSDDRGIVAVLQTRKAPHCIVGVLDCKAGLIDHLDPAASGVERELKEHPVWIIDPRQLVSQIVGECDRSGGVDGCRQIAVCVVRKVGVGSVRKLLLRHLSCRIVAVADRLSVPIRERHRVSLRIKSGTFRRAVRIRRAQQIARRVVRIN